MLVLDRQQFTLRLHTSTCQPTSTERLLSPPAQRVNLSTSSLMSSCPLKTVPQIDFVPIYIFNQSLFSLYLYLEILAHLRVQGLDLFGAEQRLDERWRLQ